MIWLKYVVPLLLWTSCNSKSVCEEPPEVDFGEIVSDERAEYQSSDRVQYRCFSGYALEGPEWITCKGPQWTPSPKCLAPCTITKQQLEAKNLLLSGGRRRSIVIQNNQTVEFLCREGYVLSTPSIRKCIEGHMNLPFCISVRGQNCSRPPTIRNGDITTLSQKQYTSGSSVEFKCQRYYAMEGDSRSFCDNGNWTKVPACLEPCVISLPRIERQNINVKLRSNEDKSQTLYLPRGDSIVFSCKPGHVLATDRSQSAFEFQCRGGPVVYPECEEIVCSRPEVDNGRVSPHREQYSYEETIQIQCGTQYEPEWQQGTSNCTKNGWVPQPTCVNLERNCGPPPHIQNGDVLDPVRAYYTPGMTLRYKCQNLYLMNGTAEVRCEDGAWTEAPICIEACVISEEDMRRNNIQLKWRNAHKLYTESGNAVEFICRWNYRPVSPASAFRTQCIQGKVEYPRCVWGQACTVSEEDMRRNNIQLKWRNAPKLYAESGDAVEFICRWNYRPVSPPSAFRTQCMQGKVEYPRCVWRWQDE